MFEKGKQPSPARQRQLDRYARLVDSLSPKSKMGAGADSRVLGRRGYLRHRAMLH